MSKPENYRLHCHDYQKITAFGNPETQARRGLEEHITIITLFSNISPCLYFRGGLKRLQNIQRNSYLGENGNNGNWAFSISNHADFNITKDGNKSVINW